jgi:hypothetical protein
MRSLPDLWFFDCSGKQLWRRDSTWLNNRPAPKVAQKMVVFEVPDVFSRRSRKGLQQGSSGRAPAWQAQGTEFKLLYHTEKKRSKQRSLLHKYLFISTLL